MISLYRTGVSRAGQTGGKAVRGGRIDGGTLLFGRQGLANMGQETWMGRAALGVVDSRLFEAELTVDSEAHFGGVIVFLAVVFPPADRAEVECFGRFESLRPAARATVAHFDRRTHKRMDGGFSLGITEGSELQGRPFLTENSLASVSDWERGGDFPGLLAIVVCRRTSPSPRGLKDRCSGAAGELPGFGVDPDLLALLNEERDLDLQASFQTGMFGDVA